MKFTSILFAAFGLSTFAAAIPAPVAAPADVLNLKNDLVERNAAPALAERAVFVDIKADVQICIDAIVAINKKYTAKKPYTSRTIKSWSIEVVAQIKVLISVISAYPSGCTYPSIDIIVAVFVKLFACIFVQLKVFIDAVGLIVSLLLSVDLLLSILLGVVGDLLNILVSLCVLIEVKVKVGLVQLIISACVGVIDKLYLAAFVKLLVKVGLLIKL